MDFQEIFVLLIVFGTVTSIVKTVFGFAKWKIKHDSQNKADTGNSLGHEELEIMIENAVSRATQDIFNEVKDLRQDIDLLTLPEKPQLSLDDLPELEKREAIRRTGARRRE